MRVHRFVSAVCAAMLLTIAVPRSSAAQQLTPGWKPDEGTTPPAVATLKVTVVISRWEGEKKVANSPFVLMVVSSYGERAVRGMDGDSTSIQMGSDYPLPAGTMADGKPTTGITYRALGTNLRAAAHPVKDAGYNVFVSVQDSQVSAVQGGMQLPRFQTFRSDNRLTIRDGQTMQFTVATDTVTGQVIKLDVTVNVVK